MAVYGFKDNKCKYRVPTAYMTLNDLIPGGSYGDLPSIATVGNNMENGSEAFFHVNNSGFPGSGEGTVLAFKTKEGTYKNYMFFDTENDDLYFLAADGTSKSWRRVMRRPNTTFSKTVTIAANSNTTITLVEGSLGSRPVLSGTEVQAWKYDTVIPLPVAYNTYIGDNDNGVYVVVHNLSSTDSVTVTVKVDLLW